MDLSGRLVTLYPLAYEGGVVTRPADSGPAFDVFHRTLADRLIKAGLDVRMPVAGLADMPLIIRPQLVLADAGSRFNRYMTSGLSGAAKFRVVALVGDSKAPFANLQALGSRRFSWYGGEETAMLADAAKLAAQRLAEQVIGVLRAADPPTGPGAASA